MTNRRICPTAATISLLMEYIIEVKYIMHPGKRKDKYGNPHQEDAIFPAEEQIKASDRLFVLCDGMGGHDSGEVASATVCQAIGSYITSHCDPSGDFTPEDLSKAMDSAFDALDAVDNGASMKMGTTMTLLKLYDRGAVVAHIGDSRVYHIRQGDKPESTSVLHRTADHSLVFEMINAGIISEIDARRSPHRNVITRALQPHLESRPKPDITIIRDIRPGDYFYVCSDGMIENMDYPELMEIFSKHSGSSDEIERIRQTLLDLTEENDDNHSAFIVHIIDVKTDGAEATHDEFDTVALSPTPTPPLFISGRFGTTDRYDHGGGYNDDSHKTRLKGPDDIVGGPHAATDSTDAGKHRRTWHIAAIAALILAIVAVLALLL